MHTENVKKLIRQKSSQKLLEPGTPLAGTHPSPHRHSSPGERRRPGRTGMALSCGKAAATRRPGPRAAGSTGQASAQGGGAQGASPQGTVQGERGGGVGTKRHWQSLT